LNRPVWLLSMDSEQFNAPPTTTAALTSYFKLYGSSWQHTDLVLQHFSNAASIDEWLQQWRENDLPIAKAALQAGLEPIVGFSFYTWNAAEFLALSHQLKSLLPQLLIIAGGPHVQQAEDYLGIDPLDVIFLGEAEVSLQEFLDCTDHSNWKNIAGLTYLEDKKIVTTPKRARCKDLDRFPSPFDVLQLANDKGEALYESISYETSRGCPFKCAFCEWGTGAIGSKMYQWPMERIRSDWNKIVAAGIRDIWLADSNFGALKQDLEKAELIVKLKEKTGLPLSFATSWSKAHTPRVQEIALLLHRNQLLPHYQLALQTLTPEALRLSNRENMSSNEYQPIAKRMSELGVPIAAELIWGLPGDNLADFEKNLDTLLATFPNINIFGYTLLPGTEFYRRREEYKIEAIPVAGYGKAKGEYVVACHSFTRDQGEEGYFLISAHILMVHGHILPLTTRLLALRGEVPVSPFLRDCLRSIIRHFGDRLEDINLQDRMSVYEGRNSIYLLVLAHLDELYEVLFDVIQRHHSELDLNPAAALQTLALDRALCPRTGSGKTLHFDFDFDARSAFDALSSMEQPTYPDQASEKIEHRHWPLTVKHPGGIGDILFVADGGSWLQGEISPGDLGSSANQPALHYSPQ